VRWSPTARMRTVERGAGRIARPSSRPGAARRCGGCRVEAKRRCGSGCIRPCGQNGVEVGEALWSVDEVVMADDFWLVTPGDVDQTNRRTRSGRRPAIAKAVAPPRDMPTTAAARDASSRTATATSAALWRMSRYPERPASEWPCPGRSSATAGRPRARRTVIPSVPFWAPPWRNTYSGSDPPTPGR